MATRRSKRLVNQTVSSSGNDSADEPVDKKSKTAGTEPKDESTLRAEKVEEVHVDEGANNVTKLDVGITVTYGPFPPVKYPRCDWCKDMGGTDYFPCLWEASIDHPIHNLVYDPDTGFLWMRLGGEESAAVWKLSMDADDGKIAPGETLVISDVEDGYGMCLDKTRQLVLVTGDKTLRSFDYGGNFNKKVTLTGAYGLSAVAHCAAKNIYMVNHSLKKLWQINADTMKVATKGKEWENTYPWWMVHYEEPCHTILCNTTKHNVTTQYANGVTSFQGGYVTGTRLNTPRDVCYDARRSKIVCDYGNNCVKRNYNDNNMGYWEEILPPEKIPGGKPSCVVVIEDKYLLVSSSDARPYKLSCFLYRPECMHEEQYGNVYHC